MDTHTQKVSLNDINKFCNRINDPESDSLSDSELWAVWSQDQIRAKLKQYNDKLENMENCLRDLVLKSNGTSHHEPGETLPETNTQENNNDILKLKLDQRSLRKFKTLQSERSKLNDYYQRRYIKNNMEDFFGEKGYENFQRLIFSLIFAVIGILIVEYSYFNVNMEKVNSYTEAIQELKTVKSSDYTHYSDYFNKTNNNTVDPNILLEIRTKQIEKLPKKENKKYSISEDIDTVEELIQSTYSEPKSIGFLSISLVGIAIFDIVVCVIFLFEYFLRLYFSNDKKWYFVNHKIDLLSSIPMSGIFILFGGLIPGDFMVLRAIRLFRIFRAMRIASFFWRGMERLEQVANVKIMRRSFMIFIFLAFAGGFMFQIVERNYTVNPDSVIADINSENNVALKISDSKDDPSFVNDRGQSFWWAVTSLTSGGFGDLYRPKTTPGWILVTILVISGIVVVGVFTATLTTIFKREDSEDMQHQQLEIIEDLGSVLNAVEQSNKKVDEIRHELHELRNKYSILQSQVEIVARMELQHAHT